MLKSLDNQTQKLIDHYKKTYLYVLARLKRQIEKGLSERQQREVLLKIRQELQRLDDAAYQWSRDVLPEYYYITARRVDAEISQLALIVDDVQPIKGFLLHRKAVEAAVKDTFSDLAKRTRFMNNEAKRIIRDNTKEIITRQLITGESRKKTIPELTRKLEKDGIPSFVDAAGRNWNIDRYSETLIKTKTRILSNEGTVNRLKEYREKYPNNRNFDLVAVSQHGAKDWCRHFEGKVFSISGNHPGYPPVSSLPNQPYSIFHPNCRHVLLPYIEILRGQGQTVDSQFLNRNITDLNKMDYHERKAQR